MSNPGKVAALVEAALSKGLRCSACGGRVSNGQCEWCRPIAAALDALTPEDVRRADEAGELAEAVDRLLNCHTGAPWQSEEIRNKAFRDLVAAREKEGRA